MEVDVDEVARALPDLLARVAAGEEIVLTRDGTPVAKLVPAPASHGRAPAQNAPAQNAGHAHAEDPVPCRLAACREKLRDGQEWSFYLINDGAVRIDVVRLCAVGYEWGDAGSSSRVDVRATGIPPGAHALVWRDDAGAAELRIDLALELEVRGRCWRVRFDIPRLYRRRGLRIVTGLGKPGLEVLPDRPL